MTRAKPSRPASTTITVFAFDPFSNKSAQASVKVNVTAPALILDLSPPITAIQQPLQGTVFGKFDSVTIAGSSFDIGNPRSDSVASVSLSFFRADLGLDIPLQINGGFSNIVTIKPGTSEVGA